jgi:putative membrane protein
MTLYLALKTFHIIAFTAWFAGLFYLPRLFVYHAENPKAGATFLTMERKLLTYIMRPAALATVFAGVAMIAAEPYLMKMGWLHAKLMLVFILIAYHGTLERFAAQFARGKNTKTGKFFRYYNEVPSVLLIAIVALAVFKPF